MANGVLLAKKLHINGMSDEVLNDRRSVVFFF
jgi:hypothetical protein